ncbi:MAG TPA: DUF6348 family protein [Terriglobales bacterium]|nr:DUF6348 family protein [Terriglobales bacterium]
MTKTFYKNLIVGLLALTVALTVAYVVKRRPSVSERCVEVLAALAKSTDTSVTSSGDRIWVGGKELRIAAQIENAERREKEFLIGLRVDISVNGVRQPFTFGTVGVGNNRDEAVQTAVKDWSLYVGRAVLDALGIKTNNPQKIVGAFVVYPGQTGIRGAGIAWSAEKDRRLLDSLDALIRKLESSPGEFHSILVLAVIHPDGTSDGQCRVDDSISTETLSAIQAFPWSKNDTTYMFKQFYILRRR